MEPETRYLKVGDVHLAYQTVGNGPVDLVHVPGIFSHLEWQWEDPTCARYLRRLASFTRLILFDPRGLGLSDRSSKLPILEQQIEDLRALLDAVGSERAVVYGVSQGGPMAILFAATYPSRTSGLILYGAYPTARADASFPWGRSAEWLAEYNRQVDQEWGTGSFLAQVAPTRADDDAFRHWWGRLERFAAGPGNALAFAQMNVQIDVRPALSTISAPTLVLHRRADTYRDPGTSRYLAEHIAGARLVQLPGIDHLPFVGDSEAVCREIEAFVSGDQPPIATDRERELATILFVDVVSSTEHVASLGDRRWGELLASFLASVRRELTRHRGLEIETAGDGVLARFDGPARAVDCAIAIRESVASLGLQLHAGLHTGEIETTTRGVVGIAVHVGARVAAASEAGEILVSSTVRDLVAGSGLTFHDRGMHALKGLPEAWHLFSVAGGGSPH